MGDGKSLVVDNLQEMFSNIRFAFCKRDVTFYNLQEQQELVLPIPKYWGQGSQKADDW